MFTASRTPNQTKSMPSLCATGASSGTKINASSKKSKKNAKTKIKILTTIRKPSAPPGNPTNNCSTQTSPFTARNTKTNTVEPIRINSTKDDNFAVASNACFSKGNCKRRLNHANNSAPVAPMAPPSVGVAMPRKIVPSTKKINNNGGTKVAAACNAKRLPRRVRAARGSAGASVGFTKESANTYKA